MTQAQRSTPDIRLDIRDGRAHLIFETRSRKVNILSRDVMSEMSRIFDSLTYHPVPSSADIGDAAFLLSLGYRTFLFGDALCFQRETVLEALNLLEAIAGQFP